MTPIRIELPTNLQVGSVNCYLFIEPEPILVDAGIGTDACWAALEAGLAEHGLTPADLSRVIITHPHIDHYGLAGRIANSAEADIWIAAGGRSWIDPSRPLWQARHDYYQSIFLPALGYSAEMIALILAGITMLNAQVDPVPMARVHTFARDGVVQMGGQAWQVIDTPGHASLQTCFYQPETQQLISADHLMALTPTPVVEAPPAGQTERVRALPQFMRSLSVVEALDVERVWPGHGRPFGNHRHVIQRQRDRIAQRKLETLDWVGLGRETAVDLLAEMYGHLPEQIRFAGMYMLVGYLDLLMEEGKVMRETVDGVWRFTAVETKELSN